MKLAVGGNMRYARMWKPFYEYAREQAAEILKDHPRIKTLRLTFCDHDPNWDRGFSWLVYYDQVEIAIPSRFNFPGRVKWLILHELMHARQILEGRLNKNLDRVVFTNRLGNTTTHTNRRDPDGSSYGRYFCLDTERYVRSGDEPWEKEANGDVDRLQRRNGVPRS